MNTSLGHIHLSLSIVFFVNRSLSKLYLALTERWVGGVRGYRGNLCLQNFYDVISGDGVTSLQRQVLLESGSSVKAG